MGGGSDEEQKDEAVAQQQPIAQALQMAQYPAYMPGQQQALASQMSQFYGAPQADYMAMLGNNAQAAERPTMRNPTDIETYLNNLATPPSAGVAPVQAPPTPAPAAARAPMMNINSPY